MDFKDGFVCGKTWLFGDGDEQRAFTDAFNARHWVGFGFVLFW
jgi:hypothetical protein